MNKFIAPIIVIVLVVGGYFYYQQMQKDKTQTEQKEQSMQNQPTPQPTPSPAVEQPVPERIVANIETSEGSFKVTLDGKAAPKTVANFIKLAKSDFYKNLTFHRIVADFVIQGGDPNGDGSGGPDYTIPAEIGLKHTKGAIAMARTGDSVNPSRASSGSQFYIALAALPELDGQYTVFGYVTSGMDVVEKISKTPTEPNPYTGEQSVPLKTVTIKTVTIEESK